MTIFTVSRDDLGQKLTNMSIKPDDLIVLTEDQHSLPADGKVIRVNRVEESNHLSYTRVWGQYISPGGRFGMSEIYFEESKCRKI